MVRAKNYETMSTFVKVMQKKLRPLFSGQGVERTDFQCAKLRYLQPSYAFFCDALTIRHVLHTSKLILWPTHTKRLKVKGRHLYTATYMNMTSSGLQCEVAY